MTPTKDAYQESILIEPNLNIPSQPEHCTTRQDAPKASKSPEKAPVSRSNYPRSPAPDRSTRMVNTTKNSSHVTGNRNRDTTKSTNIVDINSPMSDIIRHIVEHAGRHNFKSTGGKFFQISQQKLDKLTKDMDETTKTIILETHGIYSKYLKLLRFELRTESKFEHLFRFDLAKTKEIISSYFLLLIGQTAKEVCEFASQYELLQKKENEYAKTAKPSASRLAAAFSQQLEKLSQNLQKRSDSLANLVKQKSANQEQMEKLVKKVSNLEHDVAFKAQQLQKQQELEALIESNATMAKETKEERVKLRKILLDHVKRFQIVAGTRMGYTSTTTGVLTFVPQYAESFYHALLKVPLSKILTKEERIKFCYHIPTGSEVRKIFDDAKLRDHLVKHDALDNPSPHATAWEASDVVATLKFEPNDEHSVQGYGLLKCHEPRSKLRPQALKHFLDRTKVKLEVIHYCIDNNSVHPSATTTNYAVVSYSFTGTGPRSKARGPMGESQFIILSQTAVT